MHTLKKILKWVGIVIVVAFVGLVIVRMFVLDAKEKTADVLASGFLEEGIIDFDIRKK